MPPGSKDANLKMMLMDSAVPLEHRQQMLAQLAVHDGEAARAIIASILEAAASNSGQELLKKKAEQYQELINEMKAGPLRSAFYVRTLPWNGNGAARRIHVKLEDGGSAYTVVPDTVDISTLHVGDRVLLDAQGRGVLYVDPAPEGIGEEAQFERRIGPDTVEVTSRADERHVLRAAYALQQKLDENQVEQGQWLIVSMRLDMAWDVLPVTNKLARYRFLDARAVPNVVVERDIGAPPRYLGELSEVIRVEMVNPQLRREFHLHRCVMKLLSGRSGTGKTLSLYAFWRLMYRTMSEVTGAPIDQLPPRVMRLQAPQVFSKWLGESDQNLSRFVNEAVQLADDVFTAPDGTQHQLPVLAVIEELDGIARTRGGDQIYDRILTTFLQLIDPARPELRDRLIVFLATTNVGNLIDPAALRRIGMTTETFGVLDRKGFSSVLDKHIAGIPFVAPDGLSAEQGRRQAVRDITAWLFSPNGQEGGALELFYANSTTPSVRHRRDFLTGALVERVVQQAATEACLKAGRGLTPVGLTTPRLTAIFDEQIRNIVDRLDTQNVDEYLDLPDGVRLVSIRRVRQATLPAATYMRS